MIDRILEQQQPLCAALLELKKGDLMPTDVYLHKSNEAHC